MTDRILVTGVLGCLDAWIARIAVDRGHEVIGYDLGSDRSRLELVLGADESRVTLAQGDITELDELERVLDEHEITGVVHLAALQVPFVRASPSLGMRVNVQGTTNVFEAVARRLDRIPGLVYASSAAVYNASDPSPAPERGGTSPATLYGVSKLADEGIARVYHTEQGVTSVGLRPLVVYGLGRDQGMTSGPTTAMAAAVRGEPAAIAFSGLTQFDYAPDVAEALVDALAAGSPAAAVYNVPGAVATVDDVVTEIKRHIADAEITVAGDRLPFPTSLEAIGYDRDIAPFPRTSLAEGVAQTLALLASGD
jgi:UDP-glucuronate 4-epimerase